VTPSYLDRLATRSVAVGTVLCLGIDPDPSTLPAGFAPDIAGIEAFARLLVEAAAPFAAAVKPNLAFFEAYGSAGLAALERVRAAIPPGIPVVMDAKRGDIGSTSSRHAAALYDALGADAVTVSPYLGQEAIGPLLERLDRLAYVLCRTSNPGAGEVQDLVVTPRPNGSGSGRDGGSGRPGDVGRVRHVGDAAGEPLWARIARLASGWGPGGTVGLVVGATASSELAAIRDIAPGLPFLVPGVGAQGGDVAVVLDAGPATAAPAGGRAAGGLLVNVSRGIASAAADEGPGDLGEHLVARARSWSAKLPVLT